MIVEDFNSQSLLDRFRMSMRATAASVSLVTSRDADGHYHGMAVTSWASISMDPPSMLVAINRSASVHAVVSMSRRFSLNLMGEVHGDILERFSRSDMREDRFTAEHWREARGGLPVLRNALASQLCTVEATHDYGTHTIFIGRVVDVILTDIAGMAAPLIWMNGSRATLSRRCEA
ncbi:flavin reductase family protein [Mesorhizobium sp. YR577]|uniref:flavin reductase family protein n=1 Tax=Mesorhizobium sp. YR577 TaxID=1884373 RepID=UPI0008E274F1|nr:flavin reductase family protein [Mesorhizobium sp. YR577]SFU16806.1 NADH-FMN oxidoreductase RutF, flavin reductase (DIM6/NTAB) family [Mesorhizobium sp. YR577]